MELSLIVIMLILSAFFSGSEIAFVAANRIRVEVIARRRSVLGPVVRHFLHNPDTLLTTTLVGNNLALVAYSTLLAFYLEPPLARFFSAQLGLQVATAEFVTLMAQTIIATGIVLAFGEILPKSIVREVPNRSVFAFALPLRITYFILLPFVKVAAWTSSVVLRMLRVDAESFSQFMRRDFELIVRESVEKGELELDQEESEILSNVFAMNSIRVKESMVPRTDMVAVEDTTAIEDLRMRFIETGHSKLPVFSENIDNVVGIAFAYDLFGQPESLKDMMRPLRAVPETKPSKELLREFLNERISAAVVVDEYGGTAGLVTLEDLLEELFGEIHDEFDTASSPVRPLDEKTFIVSGRTELDELRAKYGFDLPEGDFETIAGYVTERLGKIPPSNEEFELDGIRFIVLQSAAHRIEMLKIIRLD
jgi:CBS domain containing-hemolysin-like protein